MRARRAVAAALAALVIGTAIIAARTLDGPGAWGRSHDSVPELTG